MDIVCYEWCIKNITLISCHENQVWKLKKAEKGQVQLARLFHQYQHEFESCQHHKKSLGFEIEVRYRQERLFLKLRQNQIHFDLLLENFH